MTALGALDITARPVDVLPRAGLGVLSPHVEPLQRVLDDMAGRSSAITAFTEGWSQVASTVDGLARRLGTAAGTETEAWRGEAGDGYRGRAADLTTALAATADVAEATGTLAIAMGEAQARARAQVHQLVSDLVRRLVT